MVWLGSLVSRALDLRLDGREFDSRSPRLVLGWVTVFERANHLGISPSHLRQLSLLLSARHEMSTGQGAVMLFGWEQSQDGSFHVDKQNVWVAGKTV